MATQVIFSVEDVNTLIRSTPENLGNIVISPTLPSDVYLEIVRRIEDSGLNHRLINRRAESTSPPVKVVTVSTLEALQHLSTESQQIVLVRIPAGTEFELANQLACLAIMRGFVVVEGPGSVLSVPREPAPPASSILTTVAVAVFLAALIFFKVLD